MSLENGGDFTNFSPKASNIFNLTQQTFIKQMLSLDQPLYYWGCGSTEYGACPKAQWDIYLPRSRLHCKHFSLGAQARSLLYVCVYILLR